MIKTLKLLGVTIYFAAALVQFASIILLFIYGPVIGVGSIVMAKRLRRAQTFSTKEVLLHVIAVTISLGVSIWLIFNFKM